MEKNNKDKEGKTNPFPKMEEEVLDFWNRAKTFDKSVAKEAPQGEYEFYDGPPFATGLPHYGHIVASVMKDAVPRYWTMKGYRVERKWGWDCHGLPIENLAEKELGLQNKQDIEKLGVEKFNDYCRSLVLRYASEWKKTIKRIGRWVDMENDYKTMDTDYMESVWWVFSELYDKGLIYQGYKAMHICPRCGTTLSNFEVTQGYKDIKDLSVVVKFEIADSRKLDANLRAEDKVYALAWTTTPWTLIGNAALAVGPDTNYVLVKLKAQSSKPPNETKQDEFYILAKERTDILKEEFEVIKEIKGKTLAGAEYEPVFNYYYNSDIKNKANGWKVYGADFVSTNEGTGIVHIAPAFGEDDMELGRKENLPFIQHVDPGGKFKAEAKDFAGMEVKPKDDPQRADVEIIKYLARENLLFAKEKIEHSYPHCWRCETPLLNYAAQSWFVKVTDIKKKLLKNNQLVNWVPKHVKEGRFGKWLEQARDWSISRNRYWGDPLPVWQCKECQTIKAIGSIEELRQLDKGITKIILVRHGESEKNKRHIFDSSDSGYALTKLGREQARQAAKQLAGESVDIIYSSPVERARETAEIIAGKIKLDFKIAEGLREVRSGSWDGKPVDDESVAEERKAYHQLPIEENYHTKRGTTGESWKDIEERSYNFIKQAVADNKGKTVLLVTHQGVIVYLLKAIQDLSLEKTVRLFDEKIINELARPISVYVDPGTFRQVDLHKQYVDKITAPCSGCGGEMQRVSEVLDCWFESGSMPYAQLHYPFENKERFEKTFPAQFIAEGIDQTRGWFYTLMVLSTGLFNQPAFRNVIVNGIVLAEDGQKMSKSKGNYPDPALVFDKYGVDAMRYYFLASPVLVGDSINFSEKGVEEVLRKISILVWNVYKFYEMFAKERQRTPIYAMGNIASGSEHVLDKWILARLDQLASEVTANMDKYHIPKAVRPIEEFISDLSTWYLRRSRDRFKGDDEKDKNSALETTAYVLVELSKIMSPFMPFLAEQLWQKVTGYDFKDNNQSVHLEMWPESRNAQRTTHNAIIDKMNLVRKIVELALAKRDEAGIKVRQPLKKLEVRSKKLELGDDFIGLIKDEINVKDVQIIHDGNLDSANEIAVELDTLITPELKKEGLRREFIRNVNAARKQAGLTVRDVVSLFFQTDSKELIEAIEGGKPEIQKDTIASGLSLGKNPDAEHEKTFLMEGKEVWLGLKRA